MLRCVRRRSAPDAAVGWVGWHYRSESPDGYALWRRVPATVATLEDPRRLRLPSAISRRHLLSAPFHRRLHLSTPELVSSPRPVLDSSRRVLQPALPSCP